jgi:6-phospho-3-hexuloisomerase
MKDEEIIAAQYYEAVDTVISECTKALKSVDPQMTKALLEMLFEAQNIFFVGVGRVMYSLKAIAKRFSHIGFNTYCVGSVTEPAITDRDLLIVGSGSGESLIPIAIAKKAKRFGAKVALIGSNGQSTIAGVSDLFVRIPVRTKMELPGEIQSSQPMTSLFEQSLLLYGDILASMIIKQKGIDVKSLWARHANLE